MGRIAPIWCGLWMVCACRSVAADPPAADDDGGTTGSATSTSDGGSETTFSAPLSCLRSNDCSETSAPFCVAPYDPGSGSIEEAACVTDCVAVGDLARACVDDDGCCEGLRCNPVDGFCAPEATESTSSGSSSGGDTDTDTSSGTSSSGSSSSGSTSATGSTGSDTEG
ncbi:MAG: hypothetical protein ACRBN8_17815 [Nannocystales bacterium]